MEPVRRKADYVIDTTALSAAGLKNRLFRLFGDGGEGGMMTVSVCTFGYKYGIPREADLVFDVRFLKNPYYQQALRPQTGLDQPVYDYVFTDPNAEVFVAKTTDLLRFLLPLYVKEGKTSLVIAVGCTGGRHRSVAVASELAAFITKRGYTVVLDHRDMNRR